MNLAKKRKLTAIITLSVMIVAIVATACILTIPNLYKGEDIATTSTAAYGMGSVQYNKDNTQIAYVLLTPKSGDEGDLRVLYPKNIYLDISESLEDAGYYVAYDAWTNINGGDSERLMVSHAVYGYYATDLTSNISNVPSNDSPAYTMHRVFDNYGYSDYSQYTSNGATISEGVSNIDGDSNRRNRIFIIEHEANSNDVLKINLKGNLKDTVKAGDTYTYTNANTEFAWLEYYSWWNWRYVSSSAKSEFSGGSGNFTGMSEVAGASYANSVSINVNIYDKSALNTAINSFQSKIDSNRDLLSKINGGDACYQRAQTFITNIKNNYLVKREVTQSQINEAVTSINNYVFELDKPNSALTGGKNYDGNSLTVSSFWDRYDATYYNLSVNGSNTSTEIKNVGTYEIKVAPKTEVNGLKFRWVTDNNNAELKVGTYTIAPATFSVTGLNKITQQFKNSNYNFNLASATSSGTLSDSNFSGFYSPSENPKTVQLYLSSTELGVDTIDWSGTSDSVAVKDVGNYYVYYKVSAPNHNDAKGSFAIEITKANIELIVGSYNQTYGDPVLTSDEIIENMLTESRILDAEDWDTAKTYIKDILTFNVEINSFTTGTNYATVGEYTINFARTSSALNNSINTITFKDAHNRSAYKVVQRTVQVSWMQKANMWYDGVGGKRPSAEIVSDNFADGTSTSLSAVSVTVVEGFDGNIPELVNYEAIYAGKYRAYVSCLNPNYIVDETTNHCDFTILRRPVTVELQNRTRTYAQSMTAPEVWLNYTTVLFPANANNSIYVATTTATDGKSVFVDSVPTVFEIDIEITNDDYTSQNDAEKYYKVNENGYDLTVSLLNKNYEFVDCKGAKFFVNPADIDLSLQQIASKVYNAQDQALVMPNNNTVIALKGYEATHRENVVVEYSDTEGGTYSTNALTLRNIGTKNVYYRVTAPNHKVNTGHFTAEITRAHIYVDVNGTKEVAYGTELPTSQELIDDFKITWSWTNQANQFDFSNEVEFAVLDGTGGSNYITSRKQNVGNYTVSHRFLDESIRDNYIFEYRTNAQGTHKNIGVYKIVPKTLYVEWAQTGGNWSEGFKYTYDGNYPQVQPVAPDTLADGTENVVVVKGEDGTSVLERDNIVLSLITLNGNGKGSYTVSTSLTNPNNQRNYVLANASETFEIIPRTIQIYAKNQTATYGNAKSVPMGRTLVAPDRADAMWDYADGSAEFINDHYASYRLTTTAQNPDRYMDVDNYPIIVEPIESATGAIVDNYIVTVVTEGASSDMQATFSITPAEIHYMGRQFNIDFDKEPRFVTKTQIGERISTNTNTPVGEFTVEMSDLLKEDVAIGSVSNWVESQTTEVGNDGLGRYYVWVRITHEKGNYQEFTAKIEVNILSDWVSIIVNNKIQAEYGDVTHSSQALFDGLNFTAIYGIMNDDNSEDKTLDEAKAVIGSYVASGDIKFIVGKGDTVTAMEKNDAFGSYSIYIIIPEGKNPAHKNFRFLAYDTNHTSNIDAYEVGKRSIGIDWGTMDEVYGEHSGSSASHTYTLERVMDGDNVDVTISYFLKTATGPEPVNGHVDNVGTYIAKVTEILGGGENYKLPDDGLEIEFQVTPRPIKVEVADNSITYGDRDATRDGINEFLNREIAGKTLYTILKDDTSMGLASGDTASNIFKLAIDATLDSTFSYWKVGSYDITVEELSDNYTITPVKGSLKVNKAGTIGYDRQQIAPKTYNGKDISVAPDNVMQYMTLTGDGDLLKSGVKVYYKLSKDDESKFAETYYVKFAGTYSVDIKITEPNHTDTIVTGLQFSVERVQVLIYMKQTEKTYGDTLDELLSADGTVNTFSDWLKKHCEIQIWAVTESGQELDVEGLEDDFIFKVIKKGQGNGDALEVGKNPVGTYRVYHLNDTELSETKYIINYYQEDDTLPDEEQYKCNAEAYKIIQREAVVNWTGGNRFEYSGNDVVGQLTASVTLLEGTRNLNYTSLPRDAFADKERMPAINVGWYTAKVDTSDAFQLYQELGNYYFSNDTFDFEIYAKAVTVTINNQTREYGHNDTKVGVWAEHTEYVTDIGDLDGQPITLSIVETTDREYYGVGKYTIKGVCHSDNYDVTFKGQDSDKDTAVFEVTEAEMSLNIVRHPISYNGSAFTADVKKIIADNNAYTLAGDMKWEEATVLYKQADGTYTSTMPVIDGVTGSNGYVVTYQVQLANHKTESDRNITIEIRPAKVVIDLANGATTVYGEEVLNSDKLFEITNAVQNVEESSMEVDINSILILKVNLTGKANKGSYNIIYELKSEYKNLYEVELNGGTDAYEITAKELTVNWNYTKPFVYNGNGLVVTATLEGIVGDDEVAIGSIQGNAYVNAGDYTAIALNVDNTNYTLGSTARLNWKIAPKAIEIEWIKDDFTYNGRIQTPSTPKIKEGQLCGADNCGIAVIALERIKAGTHDVKAESMNGNYVIANEWSTFEIKPAVVTIEWDEVELTYDGTMQAPTASVIGGLIGLDECEVVVEGKQKYAGNDYTATATLSNSNYTVVDNVTKTYSISRKAITFEWSQDTALAYTGERQVPKANAVGAVSGDAVEFEISIAEGKEGINVGSYTATVEGVLANGNYYVDFSSVANASVNYTIVKGVNEFTVEMTLPETVSKLPWNGTDKPTSKWGDVVVKYYADEACTKEITDVDNAGEGIYWIKAYVAGNDNYDEISTIIKIEVQGEFNIAIVIIGAIVSVALLIATIVVVHTANKKKQQGGAV